MKYQRSRKQREEPKKFVGKEINRGINKPRPRDLEQKQETEKQKSDRQTYKEVKNRQVKYNEKKEIDRNRDTQRERVTETE